MPFLTILGIIFLGGALLVEGIGDASYDAKMKSIGDKRAKAGEAPIYYNSKGKMIYNPTGERCYFCMGQIKSSKTGKVLYDYDEIRKNQYREAFPILMRKYEFQYYEYNLRYFEFPSNREIILKRPSALSSEWEIVDKNTQKLIKKVGYKPRVLRLCFLYGFDRTLDEFVKTGKVNDLEIEKEAYERHNRI